MVSFLSSWSMGVTVIYDECSNYYSVRFVGLRKWILGFDPNEFYELKTTLIRIENIEKEIQEVKENIKELQRILNDKADKQTVDLLSKMLETERKIVDSLEQELKEIKLKFDTLELSSELVEAQKVPADDFELEERLIKLISQGHNSPTELIRMLGISADKLYQIINRLISSRKIKKIKKGRKVYYILIEE